jgi:hypothetical protein
VSEAKYPVLCGSDSPVVLGKIKRIKSMQPKPLEDEITKSLGKQFLSCMALILYEVCEIFPPSLERSRKRHKSDDRATMAKRRALPALPSATTPLSSLSSLDPPDSDDEDNLNLPVIKLPGTPPVAEAEMETGENGATDLSITPVTVTQRTKAKKIADTAVGVATNKEGGASKRRSSRQSAGAGTQAGANEKKKSSRQSSEGAKAKKGKADGSSCGGGAVKEPEAVSKKGCKLTHPAM